jgi:hypothetical protein
MSTDNIAKEFLDELQALPKVEGSTYERTKIYCMTTMHLTEEEWEEVSEALAELTLHEAEGWVPVLVHTICIKVGYRLRERQDNQT